MANFSKLGTIYYYQAGINGSCRQSSIRVTETQPYENQQNKKGF